MLIGEKLNYTIRFQNTGNDTANLVVIVDSLDINNLDVNSFKFVSSSHDIKYDLDSKTGELKFTFADIKLVDSLTNEEGSMGYLKFQIDTKTGLAENTEVKNKAYIYFDFNPAVETNEVLNTLVSTIPADPTAIKEIKLSNSKVYPNPFTDKAVISFDNAKNSNYTLKILNIAGQLIRTEISKGNEATVNRNEMKAGMYFYTIETKNKFYKGKLMVK